jgi:hypothetical protein
MTTKTNKKKAPQARPSAAVDAPHLKELLLQALETEKGGVEIYRAAIACAQNSDLKKEWQEYLQQTRHHVEVVRDACESFGLDSNEETPGRKVIRHIGESLVKAMRLAQDTAGGEAAELVACECVTLAETKDHLNWALLTKCGEALEGQEQEALMHACAEVEDEEDEHLYHTAGWTRELWLQSLGLPAQLPPPEEVQNVDTAEDAARAKQHRRPTAHG